MREFVHVLESVPVPEGVLEGVPVTEGVLEGVWVPEAVPVGVPLAVSVLVLLLEGAHAEEPCGAPGHDKQSATYIFPVKEL